jgi:iron(III) transport system permease protein
MTNSSLPASEHLQRRTFWRRPQGSLFTWLAPASVGLVLALLVLPPIAVLIKTSLTQEQTGAYTIAHFRDLFADPQFYTATWNSLLFSGLSTALSILFGTTVAWVVVRTNAPWRGLAYVTAAVSLGTPYILHVMAWLFFLGRSGPVNELYRAFAGTGGNLFDVFSMSGMVLIQGMLWSPLVFLLLAATFERSNAEWEEAARMCGASIARTMWSISFRQAWPAITGMALFVFIRNLESFDVPVLVGGPGRVYLLTTDIYLSTTEMPPKMGRASAFSVTLIAVLSAALLCYNRYSANADRYASVTGKGYRPRPFDLGRHRWLGTAVVVLNFLFVLGLPLLVSLWLSLMPFARPFAMAALPFATLENFQQVLADRHLIGLGINTLVVAAEAATLAMLIAAVAGWLVVRHQAGARLIEVLSSIPIVFPGIVVGVAMILIALNLPIPLYGSLTLIMLAFLIRFLPYAMRYAHTGVLQIHRELEEAAGASGAGQFTVFRKIVVPLLVPALVSGWVFIFLLGANELSMSILLAGANSQVMPVAIYDRWSSGQNVEVFALGLVWTAFMSVLMLVLYLTGRRFLAALRPANL